MKKTTAPIKSIELNFVSQYSPIKNAATRNALTNAMLSATIISKGDGIDSEDTITVKMVSTIKAPPINQSCFADAT